MDHCPEIDPAQAKQLHDEKKALFVDIRDPLSYERAHIPGALPINDENIEAFIGQGAKERPVIVCCSHGNSSRGATLFLLEKGFREVYSLNGGFEEWKLLYPELKETGPCPSDTGSCNRNPNPIPSTT